MPRPVATTRRTDLAELLDFVRGRHHFVLVTTRQDGGPQVSPVSGGVDDEGRLVISTYPGRAKTVNAEREPDVSVCVLSDDFGDAWVQVDGRAEVLHMPEAEDALVDYYRCIAGEHPDWDEYRSVMVSDRRVLITMMVDKVYGATIS